MFPDEVRALQLTYRLIAWCDLSKWHDGCYRGPKHMCPGYCTEFGAAHYLKPRRAWVCEGCAWAYLQRPRPATHQHEYE